MQSAIFPAIPITYRGLDASHDLIEIRSFSKSLSGVGRLLNSSVHFMFTGDALMPRTKPPAKFYATSPKTGCVQVDVVPLFADQGFNLLSELVAVIGPEIVQRLVTIAVLLPSGRSKEVDEHFEALIKLTDQIRKDSRAVQELHIREKASSEERFIELVKHLAGLQQRAVYEAVAPIGKTCSEAGLGSEKTGGVIVDLPTAQTIRSKREQEVGDLQTFQVIVDGVTAHNRVGRFFLDGDETRPVSGDIVDPRFDTFPNLYTESIHVGMVELTAKPTLEAGKIVRLAVIDARRLSAAEESTVRKAQ